MGRTVVSNRDVQLLRSRIHLQATQAAARQIDADTERQRRLEEQFAEEHYKEAPVLEGPCFELSTEIKRRRRLEEEERLRADTERQRRLEEEERLRAEIERRPPEAIETFTLPEADKYTSRLLKYIPAEVIAVYTTLDAIIRSSERVSLIMHWGVFLFGLVSTYLYLWRVAKVTKQSQLMISTIAFFVWVFAMGGPFLKLSWYDPLYGGLLLPAYTFLIAIVEA